MKKSVFLALSLMVCSGLTHALPRVTAAGGLNCTIVSGSTHAYVNIEVKDAAN